MIRHQRLKWWLVVAVVVATSCTAFSSWLFKAWVTDNPKSAALKDTELLVVAAGSHSTGSLPKDNIPSYLWVNEECWQRLQGAMTKNSNHYTTTIEYYSGDFPNPPKDEVGVAVNFADGDHILVDYFQGGLLGFH